MSENKKSGWTRFKEVLVAIGRWIYKLRGVLLAIPVAVAAILLAVKNMQLLPEEVGINLLATGEFQMTIGRSFAVLIPLVVTLFCLLMMFCSRKMLYPWLISIFTLILPILLYVTNIML